jgi:hypothetical protein
LPRRRADSKKGTEKGAQAVEIPQARHGCAFRDLSPACGAAGLAQNASRPRAVGDDDAAAPAAFALDQGDETGRGLLHVAGAVGLDGERGAAGLRRNGAARLSDAQVLGDHQRDAKIGKAVGQFGDGKTGHLGFRGRAAAQWAEAAAAVKAERRSAARGKGSAL